MKHDSKRSFQPATSHELARFLAVAAGVLSVFGLMMWAAQS